MFVITSDIVEIMLEEQVDNDERFFETGVSAITLTEYRKEKIHLIILFVVV